MKPLLVGEAPARGTEGLPPFSGRSGAFLARVAGFDVAARFECVNLLDRWPGPQGKGSAFPLAEARAAALELDVGGRTVILAGWRVAHAWPDRAPRAYLVAVDGAHGGPLAVLPHPSGVCRWWNDAWRRDAARRFLARAARGL